MKVSQVVTVILNGFTGPRIGHSAQVLSYELAARAYVLQNSKGEIVMKFWLQMMSVCLVLLALGSPAVHVCRILWGSAMVGVTEAADSGKVTTLMWEDLQQLDLRTGNMPASLKNVDGMVVRVPGFIIPLEDNDQSVSEFLLVPFPMACIHVPAPPPNLIVHVKMEKGKRVPVNFYDPVWAQGQIKIQKTQNMYTEASYFMTGLTVSPYQPERKAP
jgi:hypothetical protein